MQSSHWTTVVGRCSEGKIQLLPLFEWYHHRSIIDAHHVTSIESIPETQVIYCLYCMGHYKFGFRVIMIASFNLLSIDQASCFLSVCPISLYKDIFSNWAPPFLCFYTVKMLLLNVMRVFCQFFKIYCQNWSM